jgi:enoyl-CoA hydratase/carnithine racemase
MSETEPPVLVERRGPKMFIALNRPRVLNAQNQALRDALVAALDELDADDDLRVAILYGTGGRAFSSGWDLKEAAGYAAGERRSAFSVHFDRLERLRKPIIAAIDGYALGGGFELAQVCDIRVAAESAVFGQPEPRTIAGTGGPALHHLARLMPLGEALLIQLTGRPMSARRAYEVGLVQRLTPDRESMLAAAEEIADEIVECAPDAVHRVKAVVRFGHDVSIEHSKRVAAALAEAHPVGPGASNAAPGRREPVR